MFENQNSVSEWAERTFGAAGNNVGVSARANQEMSELVKCLTEDDNNPKAGEEIADVVIVLYRLASRLGVSVNDEVDRKMEINRNRKWRLDGTGHGYHLKGEQQ